MNKRGPQRGRNSAIKVRCAYKKCRSGRDCKNISEALRARRVDVDLAMRRAVRSHSACIRFCCDAHLQKCTGKTQMQERGAREVLDVEQVAVLFKTLVSNNAPWAAVLMLFQVVLAERCDAMRSVKM